MLSWQLWQWWLVHSVLQQEPTLALPPYAGRTATDVVADTRVMPAQQRVSVPTSTAGSRAWLEVEQVGRKGLLRVGPESAPAAVQVVLLGAPGDHKLAAALQAALTQQYGPGRITVWRSDLQASQMGQWETLLAHWHGYLHADVYVVWPGVAEVVFGRLSARAIWRDAATQTTGLSPEVLVGRPHLPCVDLFCDQPPQPETPTYLRDLDIDLALHALWAVQRLVGQDGSELAIIATQPDPDRCSGLPLARARTLVSLQLPLMENLADLQGRLGALATATAAAARAMDQTHIDLRDVHELACGVWGHGLPQSDELSEAMALAVSVQLRPLLDRRLAKQQPALRVTDDHHVPLPASASQTTAPLGSGDCVQAGCPAGMCLVPAGRYQTGYDQASVDKMVARLRSAHEVAEADWYADDGPPVPADVSAFCIDREEASVARQQRCVTAGACPPAGNQQRQAQAPAWAPTPRDAELLCSFEGKRLATDAEWEAAMRGPRGHLMPWGDTGSSDGRANYCGPDCVRAARDPQRADYGSALPVGQFPTSGSPFGVLNGAGNVWEWVRDCLTTQRSALMRQVQVPDPLIVQGPSDHCRQLLRGGSYRTFAGLLERRVADGFPDTVIQTRGIRCVQDFGTTHHLLMVP